MSVVTRFPPSPTGYFHIGSARTALFNYLFAAREGGVMYLRFEDTDKERSKKEYEEDIVNGLNWLGIPYAPATPLRQSERLDAYRAYLHALIEKGAAYEAEEGEKGGGKVVRFKNPNVRVTFSDLIRGEVSFDTTELKDFVIARNIDDPLYHLAVVADDHDMGITHIIRGEDHISNTQRQILILEALGFARPIYAHIPLILAPDRTKLSKRNFAASVNDYRRDGYLPEAFVNYLALLGWTPPGEEKLSVKELVQKFDIQEVHKSGAIFDIQKLKWLNREYMRDIPDAAFLKELLDRVPAWNVDIAAKLMPLARERMSVWSDLESLKADFDFFFAAPALDIQKIPGKGSDATSAARHLSELRKLLETLPSSGSVAAEQVKGIVWEYAEREGRGAVLWPLRYALTGKERSPDPFVVSAVLGKEATLMRIGAALGMLKDS
ncbi:hypothetical protein A2853_02350 [Candidatus Kaiserbacteria bacterium RIFCSPHIGHO2_01_FULL_55_17]|uniref:Glutamate--tRNA ligase n=1 Tax=Candidatus Kaiserbacteria bacterium RIFCSPHIGHO2_01_FULL_55_17 TaxID=1798484 RepID=A0A1F6D7E9_9BACT|nr:MAG: hypothetical protein A2853_02350 [Candidatus Kaiserbacteria bacterium RIFCSPHIGHO2_01_FULL_55_17]